MDGVLPFQDCWKQNYHGGAWVSSGYIRNKGQVTIPTLDWDLGFQPWDTNNPPPSQIYVRVDVPGQGPGNGKPAFYLNGQQQPRLILTRGKKYQFNINTIGFPFFFTTSSTGGPCSLAGNVTTINPSDYDTRTYTIGDKFPQNFYYQCSKYPGLGGQVLVVD